MAITSARRRPRRKVTLWSVAVGTGGLLIVIRTWPVQSAVCAGLAAAVAMTWTVRYSGRRARAHRARHVAPTRISAYRAATPGEFEQQLAALCRRDGCTRITTPGGAGDLAADVLLTTPDGRRMLIQAKRYKPGNTVGSEHVQMVNGTYRDIHGCDLAAIVTTSTFTRDAIALAARLRIRLYDGAALQAWADGTGRPPWA